MRLPNADLKYQWGGLVGSTHFAERLVCVWEASVWYSLRALLHLHHCVFWHHRLIYWHHREISCPTMRQLYSACVYMYMLLTLHHIVKLRSSFAELGMWNIYLWEYVTNRALLHTIILLPDAKLYCWWVPEHWPPAPRSEMCCRVVFCLVSPSFGEVTSMWKMIRHHQYGIQYTGVNYTTL